LFRQLHVALTKAEAVVEDLALLEVVRMTIAHSDVGEYAYAFVKIRYASVHEEA
jgi:hypothetical protein